MTPEKRVQNAITKYLTQLEDLNYPILHFRRQAGGYSYKSGLPDIFFVYGGKHVEVEVKAPGGELRPLQIKWQQIFAARGIDYVCVDDIAEFKKFMTRYIGKEI